MSKHAQNLNDAMNVLGGYFGAVSRADFMYKSLGVEGNATPTTFPATTAEQADTNRSLVPSAGLAAQKILDIIDGGLFTSEIVAQCNINGADASMWDGLNDDEKKGLRKSFTICGIPEGVDDPIGFKPTITLATALGSEANTVNKSANPTAAEPGLAAYQVNNPGLNFANRDTGAVQVFLNAIPSVEFSRCHPYVNMTLVSKGKPVDADGRPEGTSLFRFLNGRTTTAEGSVDRILAEAQPLEQHQQNAEATAAETPPPGADAAAGEEAGEPAESFAAAGMEIFTNPQTMLPVSPSGVVPNYASYDEMGAVLQAAGADGDREKFQGEPGTSRATPIIDIMRPFMTLEKIKIKVQPTRGPMSMKTGEISIKLHDRSRLSEIAGLTKPSQFGTTHLILEWGWSHPDGQVQSAGGVKNINNPFGAFLNSLRTKEKLTVFNSKYSFETDGQVSITLNVVSMGSDNTSALDIGLTPEINAQWLLTERLIESCARARAQVMGDEGLRDIIGDSVIASISPSNVNDMINGDDARELQRWINRNARGEGAVSELATLYGQIRDSGAAAARSLSAVIASKTTKAYNGQDPWFLSQGADGTKNGDKITVSPQNSTRTNASFGKLAMLFMGLPLAATGRFEEVQLFFYPFNKNASYMRGKTIANFPITRREFNLCMNELTEEHVQVNITQWFNKLNDYCLKSLACKAYGFGNLYTRNSDGEVTVRYNRSASALSTRKDTVLETVYGAGADLVFRQPMIRMYSECVPHESNPDPNEPGPQKSIMRLHFVDTQCTSYASYGEMLMATRNNAMSALSTTAQQFEDADPAGDQWLELIARASDQADALGFLEAAEGGYVRMVGGAPAIKYFVKSNMPHINYGSAHTAITKCDLKTMGDSANATIHMIRAQRAGGSDQEAAGDQDRGLPARMMPMGMSMEMLGCPLINFMQQFFVDFGTGTTIDNIYAVTQVEHELKPGDFKTKVKFAPLDAYGRYESLGGVLDQAIATLSGAE